MDKTYDPLMTATKMFQQKGTNERGDTHYDVFRKFQDPQDGGSEEEKDGAPSSVNSLLAQAMEGFKGGGQPPPPPTSLSFDHEFIYDGENPPSPPASHSTGNGTLAGTDSSNATSVWSPPSSPLESAGIHHGSLNSTKSQPIPIPLPLALQHQPLHKEAVQAVNNPLGFDDSMSSSLPLHSDFTVPTSNVIGCLNDSQTFSPPPEITHGPSALTMTTNNFHNYHRLKNGYGLPPSHPPRPRPHEAQHSERSGTSTNAASSATRNSQNGGTGGASNNDGSRRSVFANVGKRYGRLGSTNSNHDTANPSTDNGHEDDRHGEDDDLPPGHISANHGRSLSSRLPVFEDRHPNSPPPTIYNDLSSASRFGPISPLTPNDAPRVTGNPRHRTTGVGASPARPLHSNQMNSRDISSSRKSKNGDPHNHRHHHHHHHHGHHETSHAKSLLLGLAFLAIWTPNNIMAPNLTQMAEYFGMDEGQRDLYLGSYCALAVGVFSLPLSGLIGFVTDLVPNRKLLYVATVLLGGLSSAVTGWSPNYGTLFLARLVNGGCMSGSVPVAFSLLGDLFTAEERSAASSVLTAMMGCGILVGQVYAGVVGSEMDDGRGWSHAFFVSSGLSVVTALLVLVFVQEPVRGGKEKALQDLMRQTGTKYDRKLTWQGFVHAMKHNPSNSLLIWQGFFTSLPWGIVFVFLNDFLSQEKGFSVPDATLLVMLFGIGCAIGGILGGACGQVLIRQRHQRYLLPLFMAGSTFFAIAPFLALLNINFLPNTHNNLAAMTYCILGGVLASLPSVNVRPCILNVNPPETRGAALTAANLMIALARGAGPSCITLLVGMFPETVTRQGAFNITLSFFWTITSMQLLALAKTLPHDQDKMEAELATYAAAAAQSLKQQFQEGDENQGIDLIKTDLFHDEGYVSLRVSSEADNLLQPQFNEEEPQTPSTWMSRERPSLQRIRSATADECETSVVSIEERITSFDNQAARQSLIFMQQGIREIIQEERLYFGRHCGMACGAESPSSEESDYNGLDAERLMESFDDEPLEDDDENEARRRQWLWLQRQQNDSQQRRRQQTNEVPDLPSLAPSTNEETQNNARASASENTPLLS